MTKVAAPGASAPGWVLTYRKSGRTRRFSTLAAARRAHVRAAARFGTRWLSLRLERLTGAILPSCRK